MIFVLKKFYKQHYSKQNYEKPKVEEGELLDVICRFSRVMLGVLSEGDKTCKGSDE